MIVLTILFDPLVQQLRDSDIVESTYYFYVYLFPSHGTCLSYNYFDHPRVYTLDILFAQDLLQFSFHVFFFSPLRESHQTSSKNCNAYTSFLRNSFYRFKLFRARDVSPPIEI